MIHYEIINLFTILLLIQNTRSILGRDQGTSASVSSKPGKEYRPAGPDLNVGYRSEPQASSRLLDDLLGRNQVNDSIGCLVKILLGPIMVDQLLAL
jgi:hypothetical protein